MEGERTFQGNIFLLIAAHNTIAITLSSPLIVPDLYIIFATVHSLLQVSLEDPGNDPLITLPGGYDRPLAMDHFMLSEDSGLLFFTDYTRQVISSMYLNGSGEFLFMPATADPPAVL